MSIFIGNSEIKNAYIGTTPVKEIYVGTTKVRPSGWKPGANTIAYYPFTSATTVNDKSGNNNTLTNSGCSFGDYLGVSCLLKTSGTNLYGAVANIPLGASPRTVSVWISSDGNSRYTCPRVWGSTVEYKRFSLFLNGNYAFFSAQQGAIDVADFFYIGTNAWHNIVITYDGNTVRCYGDGGFKGSRSGTLNTNNTNLYVGSEVNNSNKNFKGKMSNLIIENKARTAQEISDYYNQTKSNYGL